MSQRSTYKPASSSGDSSYFRSMTRAPYSGLPGSNEMRGTDIIAEYLLKERVPYILGYAGHGAIGLLDGIVKIKDRIRHISPTGGASRRVHGRRLLSTDRRAARRLRVDWSRAHESDDRRRERLLR